MNALWERSPGVSFEIFTTVPEWFFTESLSAPFCRHETMTDVGLVQSGPLWADLPETLRHLKEFLPFDPVCIKRIARKIQALKCALVLCDISPLGIAAARYAGVPSVLVENFTWDWVYGEYVSEHPAFNPYIAEFASLFSCADFHIQASPVCLKKAVDLITEPVSRKPRSDPQSVRKRLQIPEDAPVVLITMGGIPKDYGFIDQLSRKKEIFFVVPGTVENRPMSENVILLPHHSAFFHPDLVHASDAVVGKVGYSTLAEVYHAGVPYGYVKRTRFQESLILGRYIEENMHGFAIDAASFESGKWLLRIHELLNLPTTPRRNENGADQSAEFLLDLLEGVF